MKKTFVWSKVDGNKLTPQQPILQWEKKDQNAPLAFFTADSITAITNNI